ncbi:flagellar protein FlgN [Pseudohalocynthiibacter aestuariivivens]|uniref:Flagellar export chaperone FlgN n=1 Tax=Roseovarius pelagicus TaxID=2980108 RepID=A0ABY6D8M8_9RHOB|nr:MULTISPECIES: flagellar export chaperone FlgN [Rhodobacterales]QIE45778.1 flagellar protein FlgN [Pseudohalocynthiibacter aestuariivivens]UXX82294.1 flagellar export chaperone FlgN [Roseovarius pelagicus]
MTDNTVQVLIDRLDTLLEKERRALLVGDLDAIGGLLAQKEHLIDALNIAAPDAQHDLRPVQGKVARNQALLDGALQGIRKVATRMAAFRKIRRTLETYDESGRKLILQADVEHKVEKRA